MADRHERRPTPPQRETMLSPLEAVSFETRPSSPERPAQPVALAAPPAGHPTPEQRPHPWRKWLWLGGAVLGLGIALWYLVPWVETLLNTVSTDDAYVNGHVTFVAPRIADQVKEVLVDDNDRVHKGDLLVRLDKEPYQVQVAIKQAAVIEAESNLTAAQAQVRSLEALGRSQRWQLQYAIEQVENQIANLNAKAAAYESARANLELARANFRRGEELAPSGGISKEELDQRRQAVKVAEAAVEQAIQEVYAIRVSLGLPARPPKGHPLTEVPANLTEIYSAVRTALANLVQTAAQIGLPLPSASTTPSQFLAQFPSDRLDRILRDLIPRSPAVKEAQARLLQARRDLDQAQLNLRYCDIVAEIDGVVTRRNVNPGNYVQVGQQLMAVRSLTEIWIDANFKETQLAYLRIGQHVRLEVDMYGRHHEFQGRITGFTMGTGSTLALLPPENATGNFVKIVQRLPVRIEVLDYHPEKFPLFIGLSVTPYVYYKEPPTGPHAGEYLRPPMALPQAPINPKP